MKLLKKQRNEIAKIINRGGFQPEDFRVKEREEGAPYIKLIYGESGYFCSLDEMGQTDSPMRYLLSSSPGYKVSNENAYAENWEQNVVGYIENWLKRLRYEVEEPDLLSGSEKVPFSLLTPEPSVENEPFPKDEISEIRRGMEEIRSFLLNETSNEPTQGVTINITIDSINNYAGKLPKKDWMAYAVGAMGLLMKGLSITAEARSNAWNLLQGVVSVAIRLVHYLGSKLL